jgi:hypothetical protein
MKTPLKCVGNIDFFSRLSGRKHLGYHARLFSCLFIRILCRKLKVGLFTEILVSCELSLTALADD